MEISWGFEYPIAKTIQVSWTLFTNMDIILIDQ
jgi:hypothetical protein